MIPPLRFTASPEDASQRLDQLLRERFPQFSRARLQEWIRSGGVRVAGLPSRASHTLRAGTRPGGAGGAALPSRPSHPVRAGETIEVEPANPPALRATPETIPLS